MSGLDIIWWMAFMAVLMYFAAAIYIMTDVALAHYRRRKRMQETMARIAAKQFRGME